MLYDFLLPFKDSFSIINLFEYITFRAAISAITALIISFIIGPWVIHILQINQIGEEIRSTGPKSHMKKEGTPTMGGVIILMAVLLPTLLFSKINSVLIQIIIFATIWMGVIGFLDDYLKVIKKAFGKKVNDKMNQLSLLNSSDFKKYKRYMIYLFQKVDSS